MIFRRLNALFHPSHYHGWGKNNQYFEGWYYKLISADESEAIAIIPGIAMDTDGTKHAFIQILDGKRHTAEYIKFESKHFSPTPYKYEVSIGDSLFTSKRIFLNAPNLNGELTFSKMSPWPSSWYSPGIMGPFSFVPFMQCYHGILSMNHDIKGQIIHNAKKYDFENGKGYMEKDWGSSFPSAYVWLQSNHFSKPNVSIKASIANIPWLSSSFVGHIAGVLVDEEIIQFTTYNFTKLRRLEITDSEVIISMENRHHLLNITTHKSKATSLASPIQGLMDGRIEESMTASIDVYLFDKKKKRILLEDTGYNAGLEVAGNISEITTK